MSRKLVSLVLALGILTCSMAVKTALSGGHSSTKVVAGNGPDPMPAPAPKSPEGKKGT